MKVLTDSVFVSASFLPRSLVIHSVCWGLALGSEEEGSEEDIDVITPGTTRGILSGLLGEGWGPCVGWR